MAKTPAFMACRFACGDELQADKDSDGVWLCKTTPSNPDFEPPQNELPLESTQHPCLFESFAIANVQCEVT